jgi:hypothetical protein
MKMLLVACCCLFLAPTHVIIYQCPLSKCRIVQEFAEKSKRSHYCVGTPAKPHSKQMMKKIGEKDVGK